MWIPVFRKNANVKSATFVRAAIRDFDAVANQLLNYLQVNATGALALVFPYDEKIQIQEQPNSEITLIWLDDTSPVVDAYKKDHAARNFELALKQADLNNIPANAQLSEDYENIAILACKQILFSAQNSSSEAKEQDSDLRILTNLQRLGFDREKVITEAFNLHYQKVGGVAFLQQSEHLLERMQAHGVNYVFSVDMINQLLADVVRAYHSAKPDQHLLEDLLQKLSRLVSESYSLLFSTVNAPVLHLDFKLEKIGEIIRIIQRLQLTALLQPMYALVLGCVLVENGRKEVELFVNPLVPAQVLCADHQWTPIHTKDEIVYEESRILVKNNSDEKSTETVVSRFVVSDLIKKDVLLDVISAIQPQVDPKPVSIQALWILFSVMPLIPAKEQNLAKILVTKICQDFLNERPNALRQLLGHDKMPEMALLSFDFLSWLLNILAPEKLKISFFNAVKDQIGEVAAMCLDMIKNKNAQVTQGGIEKFANKARFLDQIPLQAMRIKLPKEISIYFAGFGWTTAWSVHTLHFLFNPFNSMISSSHSFYEDSFDYPLSHGHTKFTALKWLLALDSSVITFNKNHYGELTDNAIAAVYRSYVKLKMQEPHQLKKFLRGRLAVQDQPPAISLSRLDECRRFRRTSDDEYAALIKLAKVMAEDGLTLRDDSHAAAKVYVQKQVDAAVQKLTKKIVELNEKAESKDEPTETASGEEKEGSAGVVTNLSVQKAQVLTQIKAYIEQRPLQLPRDSILEWLQNEANLKAARILARFSDEDKKPEQNRLAIWFHEVRESWRTKISSTPESVEILKDLCGSNPLYREEINAAIKALVEKQPVQVTPPSAPNVEAASATDPGAENDLAENAGAEDADPAAVEGASPPTPGNG